MFATIARVTVTAAVIGAAAVGAAGLAAATSQQDAKYVAALASQEIHGVGGDAAAINFAYGVCDALARGYAYRTLTSQYSTNPNLTYNQFVFAIDQAITVYCPTFTNTIV